MGWKPLTSFVAGSVAFLLLVVILGRDRDLASAADAHDSDREAIRAVLAAQDAAWNRGDVDAFLVGYWHSPELTFSGSSGVSRGWDGVLARYKRTYPDRASMGELDTSEFEFRFLGPDAALVLGKWHLKREKGDIGGVFTLVFQRLPEGWRIIHDHTSAVERLDTAQDQPGEATELLTKADGQPSCEAVDKRSGRIVVVPDCKAGRLVSRIEPLYSPLARQTRIAGLVKLHALIGKDGRLKKVEVVSGHPLLIQSAMDAVKQWQYEPTLLKGKAVVVDTEIDVIFSLNQPPS
ncbi:MAG TPA: TonB family protein [Candidatus Angelobacter sp.]|nr:TonB family protein [Candidatus Angelobacter sp.]